MPAEIPATILALREYRLIKQGMARNAAAINTAIGLKANSLNGKSKISIILKTQGQPHIFNPRGSV